MVIVSYFVIRIERKASLRVEFLTENTEFSVKHYIGEDHGK